MKCESIREVFRHAGVEPTGGTAYAPCLVRVHNHPTLGDCELLYTQGGTWPQSMFPNVTRDPSKLTDPNRSTDPICVSFRGEGEKAFTRTRVAVVAQSPDVFLHMRDEEYVRHNPQGIIGSTASPSVYYEGNLFHMWFTATVADGGVDPTRISDEYIAATHPTAARQFTLFHAVSLDGVHFMRVPHHAESLTAARKAGEAKVAVPAELIPLLLNRALQGAALYFGEFESRESWPRGAECGINTVWALPQPDYVHLVIQCMFGGRPAGYNQKNGLVRYHRANNTFEQWTDIMNGFIAKTIADDIEKGMVPKTVDVTKLREWEPIVNGRLGDWFTCSSWVVGTLTGFIAESVIATPQYLLGTLVQGPDGKPLVINGRKFPRGRYMLTGSPDGVPMAAWSDDNRPPLTSWTPAEEIKLSVEAPGFPGTQVALSGLPNLKTTMLSENGDALMFATNSLGLHDGIPEHYQTAIADGSFSALGIAEGRLMP